jgi:hypothetical protein
MIKGNSIFILILLCFGCKTNQSVSKTDVMKNNELENEIEVIFQVPDTVIVKHFCAKNKIYNSSEFKYDSFNNLMHGWEEFYMGNFFTDFLSCLTKYQDAESKKILLDIVRRIYNDSHNFISEDEYNWLNILRYDYLNRLPKADIFPIYFEISKKNIQKNNGHNLSKSFIYFVVKYFQNDKEILDEYTQMKRQMSHEKLFNKLELDIKTKRIVLDLEGYINQ